MVEENINNDQYLTQAIDGSLRSLMASDALREKSNYDTYLVRVHVSCYRKGL